MRSDISQHIGNVNKHYVLETSRSFISTLFELDNTGARLLL